MTSVTYSYLAKLNHSFVALLESASISVMVLVLFVLLWLFLIRVWVRITGTWRGGRWWRTRLAVRPFLMLLLIFLLFLGFGWIYNLRWVHRWISLTIFHLWWVDWCQRVTLGWWNNRRVVLLVWNTILIQVLEAWVHRLSGRVSRLLDRNGILWILGLGLIAWSDWLSSSWVNIDQSTWLVRKTILCLISIFNHWMALIWIDLNVYLLGVNWLFFHLNFDCWLRFRMGLWVRWMTMFVMIATKYD